MKKVITLTLAVFMALSLVACGGVPSDEKIKATLDEDTITVEDAKAKGWIDNEWIDKNFEKIEAKTKIHFKTTYLDGTPASSEQIE